jgi:hypothetical protein
MLVKAGSNLPLLRSLGRDGWLAQYVRMICSMVAAHSVSMHSSTTDGSIGR